MALPMKPRPTPDLRDLANELWAMAQSGQAIEVVAQRMEQTLRLSLGRKPLPQHVIAEIIKNRVANKIAAGQDITPDDWFAFARDIEQKHGVFP